MTPEEHQAALKALEETFKANVHKDLAKIGVYELGIYPIESKEIKSEEIPHRYDRQKRFKRFLSRVKKCECGQVGYERWVKTSVTDFQNRTIHTWEKPGDDLDDRKFISGPFIYPDYTICKVICDKCFEPYRQESP